MLLVLVLVIITVVSATLEFDELASFAWYFSDFIRMAHSATTISNYLLVFFLGF
jgi:hypothetical protein